MPFGVQNTFPHRFFGDPMPFHGVLFHKRKNDSMIENVPKWDAVIDCFAV